MLPIGIEKRPSWGETCLGNVKGRDDFEARNERPMDLSRECEHFPEAAVDAESSPRLVGLRFDEDIRGTFTDGKVDDVVEDAYERF